MITAGTTFDPGASAEGIVLTAEQYDIPTISANVGGTQPATTVPSMPVGLLVAGIIAVGLTLPASEDLAPPPITPLEISVVPSAAIVAEIAGVSLKQTYEQLRQQMLSDGLRFLNLEELEREIADRKGNRS